MANAFVIALGSNLPSAFGGPQDTLRKALNKLQKGGAEIKAVSQFYRTPCFPAGAGPDYVNAAAALDFGHSPDDLLKLLHQVEAEFGRERVQRWGHRTLDLDLIAAGDVVWPDAKVQKAWRMLPLDEQIRKAPDQLILPHPRVQDRAFVLVPMADIAPDWLHPVLNKTVLEMLNDLPASEIAEVKRL